LFNLYGHLAQAHGGHIDRVRGCQKQSKWLFFAKMPAARMPPLSVLGCEGYGGMQPTSLYLYANAEDFHWVQW
jgi:hypothetical protein